MSTRGRFTSGDNFSGGAVYYLPVFSYGTIFV
jgi:hypothetical protein